MGFQLGWYTQQTSPLCCPLNVDGFQPASLMGASWRVWRFCSGEVLGFSCAEVCPMVDPRPTPHPSVSQQSRHGFKERLGLPCTAPAAQCSARFLPVDAQTMWLSATSYQHQRTGKQDPQHSRAGVIGLMAINHMPRIEEPPVSSRFLLNSLRLAQISPSRTHAPEASHMIVAKCQPKLTKEPAIRVASFWLRIQQVTGVHHGMN